MNLKNSMFACFLLGWASISIANPSDELTKAVQAAGQSSGNASASSAHSLAATGQLVFGAVAVPILASGAVTVSTGKTAMQSGGSLMNAANHPIGQPLPITNETVSILPPNKALQNPITPQN